MCSAVNDYWGEEINEILPNLYLGSVFAIKDLKNIDQIISIISNDELGDWDPFDSIGLPRKVINFEDKKEGISRYLDEVVDFIHELLASGKRVFIHCYAGISRSPSFVIAYLIKYKHMSYKKAEEFVGNKRDIINPHSSLKKEVIYWAELLK